MLKTAAKQPEFQWEPKKKVKLDVSKSDDYNEFKGEAEEQPEQRERQREHERHSTANEEHVKFCNWEEENQRNKGVYMEISQATKKIRKIDDVRRDEKSKKEKLKEKVQVKLEENAPKQEEGGKGQKDEVKGVKNIESKKGEDKPKKKVKQANGLSNWASFLAQSTPQSKTEEKPSSSSQRPSSTPKKTGECVALDCEFVKSGDEEVLARISIVNEAGQHLLDSYIKPNKKITDFVTEISGITYLHIKNAPDLKTVLDKAKKIMYSKLVVGHTIRKDIEVCGLKDWKGWKALIDINDYQEFKEKNGKLISLKNLTSRHLGRSIQEARHSSVEDAVATMDLFLLRRSQILKHFHII